MIVNTNSNSEVENDLIFSVRLGNGIFNPIVTQDLPSNDEVVLNQCDSPDECYEVEVTDSGGDGICCGDGNGFYRVLYNGKLYFHNRFAQ